MTNFQVCRCCLRENPAYTYAIFDTITVLGVENNDCDVFEFGESLCAALLTCAPNLHLAPGDGLPEVICDHCFLRVRDTLAFRRRCEESERELKRRYADTERAIEEALHLVNLLDTKGQQVADDLGCTIGLQLTGELGPNELAILDDILQLEEYSLEHVSDSEISTKKQCSKGLIQRTVKDLRLLNDTETVGERLQTSASTVETRADQPGQPASPQHTQTDSSASNTDCSSVNARDNTPRSRHPCPECEKKFTRKFQLKLHMISVHKLGDGLQYECDICYKTFASRHSLSYHQRSVHSDERPFACSYCDRRFVLRTQLSSHLRIHTGEAKPRNFECLECGKRWPTKSVLRTHMRTHVTVQERPFKCDQCAKAFFTRGHLNSHLLVHSGEKPFACPTCGKSYQCVGNLNNHMARQHDFERSAVRGRNATSENSEL